MSIFLITLALNPIETQTLMLLNKELIYRPPFLYFFFHILQVVTELDAFPKVEETYVEQTATGASGRRVILYISGLYCTLIALLYLFTQYTVHLLPYWSYSHNIL